MTRQSSFGLVWWIAGTLATGCALPGITADYDAGANGVGGSKGGASATGGSRPNAGASNGGGGAANVGGESSGGTSKFGGFEPARRHYEFGRIARRWWLEHTRRQRCNGRSRRWRWGHGRSHSERRRPNDGHGRHQDHRGPIEHGWRYRERAAHRVPAAQGPRGARRVLVGASPRGGHGGDGRRTEHGRCSGHWRVEQHQAGGYGGGCRLRPCLCVDSGRYNLVLGKQHGWRTRQRS